MHPHDVPVDRRTVLAAGTAGVAGVALVGLATDAEAAARYFRHGVASGDPMPTSVILWTRVTPTQAATPGSGNGPAATVTWQVATDAAFRRIVRQGTVTTTAARDHTVKLDATGLRPATDYHYRFLHRGVASPAGRVRTAPAADADVAGLRLGVASCANLQAGWFAAYRHLAARDDLDAVLHLGDYFYEYGPGQYGHGFTDLDVRTHQPPHETVTLADYRQRHAQYKSDPDLQALHARHPFIVTWDDHEVTNDQWAEGAENHQPGTEGDFAVRRAAAQRAYDEWMPVRMGPTTGLGDGTRLFRRLRFGRLAELSLLDLRSHRSGQVALGPGLPGVSDPARTITGRAQMEWLKSSLQDDRAVWKLVGNPVMIAPVVFPPLPADLARGINDVTGLLPEDGIPYNTDQWDGYTADRRELFRHLRDNGVQNTVFLTGDIHSGWACDLPVDAGTYPLSGSVGTELVCTSVTSNNLKDITGTPPRTTSVAVEAAIQTANRHVKYLNFDDHGFSVLDVTPERVQMDWFVVSSRRDRIAGAWRAASWQTRAGTQRVRPAAGGIV
ncbi:alkaline phosphatase D family protein [Nocardioides caldifontis]|uniref:alkaline phosphatase D family protein n=1 Tax=Nocardioides caldifontis TaxID=2588938 RepID=UPI0011DF3A36|nr:alkaline phosphatase D family protein [Nocardioides caldifontis]